jgi:cobalamin transport system ATP-binding protein
VSHVECRGLSIQRGGVRVVRDVDLTVAQGEWIAVVGHNGAGKTSLLHALAGLVAAEGHVRVGGLDPSRTSRKAMSRVVALMPQRPVVPEGMSVRDLVALGRTPYVRRFGSETAADRTAVADALASLRLEGFAGRAASELSGGELQRVVLARALSQQPQVLLLDEPTTALDVGHQQVVLDLVDAMRLRDQITVVAAMHDLTLAGQYGQRVVLMSDGRLVADGPPGTVLTARRLTEVYGARLEVLDRPDGPVVLPVRTGGDP